MTQPAEAGQAHAPFLKDLPKSVQDGVENILQIIKIKRGNWYMERTPQQINELIPNINGLAQEYFDRIRPFKNRGTTWKDAVYEAWCKASTGCIRIGRDYAWTRVYDIASRMLTQNNDELEPLALAAAVETVRDQMGVTNPWESKLRLHAFGAERVSFKMVKELNQKPREMLVMDFPLIFPGRKHISGILFREDGRKGDSVLGHIIDDLDYSYDTLRPLIPSREILSE